MEQQRALRLGDIVDDYCPRERRITNHAIVAIVEDTIRQTRCSTCDGEHSYKGGHEPKRRRKDGGPGDGTDAPGQLVGTRVAAQEAPAPVAPQEPPVAVHATASPVSLRRAGPEPEPAERMAPLTPVAPGVPADDASAGAPDADAPHDEAWTAHRRLIRATLPRVEGEPTQPRPIPEFTMHQRPPQSQGRRAFRSDSQPNWNGNGHHASGPRQERSGNQAHTPGQGRPRRRRGRHKRAQ